MNACQNESAKSPETIEKIVNRSLDTLSTIPKEKWPEIWNALNSWQWCDLLGEKPEDFDILPNWRKANWFQGQKTIAYFKSDIVGPLHKVILHEIGYKECLRYLHTQCLGYSDEEFERWWIRSLASKE